MQFQALSSTVRYSKSVLSSKGRVTLFFDVMPCGIGKLEFSDGSRLLGCDDLSQEWGSPLTTGILSEKLKKLGHRDIDEKFWLPTTIHVTSDALSAEHIKRKFDKLNKYRGETEELFKGVAFYSSNDEFDKELSLVLLVDEGILDDLLLIRFDSTGKIFFDVDILGLEDDDYGAWGRWDLDDKSDCDDGNLRVIHDFSIKRITSFFPDYRHYDRRQKEKREDKEEFAKLRSMVSELVAIEAGRMDGAVASLLRLNLFALLAIAVIGILALLALYF